MDNQHTVYVMPIDQYDETQVYEQLKWAIGQLGGFESILEGLPKSARVMLKPNLLRHAEVERAIITHPVVMGAVARILDESGYTDVAAGDSCGIGNAMKIMKDSGMKAQLEKHHVLPVEFSSGTKTDLGDNAHTTMVICDEILKADAIINVCKMKTHALERITGAVKNLYGTVYGTHKALGHKAYPNAHAFAGALIELNKYLKTRLHIMDGIMALEGNGPASGDPTPMKLLFVSKDPVALDTVFARLIYLEPKMVPTITLGDMHGLGTMQEDQIRIVMPSESLTQGQQVSMDYLVKHYGNPDYDVDRKKEPKIKSWIAFFAAFRIFQKKPYIEAASCVKCGICVKACPVEGKAVTFKHGKDQAPVYDYKKCIRCYCCQEMCPNKAIKVRR